MFHDIVWQYNQIIQYDTDVQAAQNSNIVLMDEPTSSVDPKTQLFIYQRLFEAFNEKVIVSALHRLHLLTYFDYMYVLHNGRITDEGSFEFLRRNSPHFQELWKHREK